MDQVIDWRPIDRFLKEKLKKRADAVENRAYPPLAMFKMLLLQRWYGLSDQGMADALADRISFCLFSGFATTLWNRGSMKSSSIFQVRN